MYDRVCCRCPHFCRGDEDWAGYVACDQNALDIDLETRPINNDGRPRTLDRISLDEVWIRSDAALRPDGCDGSNFEIACWQPRPRTTERARRYAERHGYPPWTCPDCKREYPGATANGQRRRTCSDPQCSGRYGGSKKKIGPHRSDKLTPEQVRGIRDMHTNTTCGYKTIAKRMGLPMRSVKGVIEKTAYLWVGEAERDSGKTETADT